MLKKDKNTKSTDIFDYIKYLFLTGDVHLQLIKPYLLLGSPMIATVNTLDMVEPINNRFKKKKIIIKCMYVGNPGSFLFLNTYKRYNR